jgi:type VI protein secretion system component VasF
MQKYFKRITKLRNNFILSFSQASNYNDKKEKRLGRWLMEWISLLGMMALYIILSIDFQPNSKKIIQKRNNY